MNNKEKNDEKSLWIWKGKPTNLNDMNIYQLETCRDFIKNNPKGSLFGRNKSYWSEKLGNMIAIKSTQNTNSVIHHINRVNVARVEKFTDAVINRVNKINK